MIVLEYIVISQGNIAEWTSLMAINGLEDACLAVYVSTPCYITVLDVIEADVAQ